MQSGKDSASEPRYTLTHTQILPPTNQSGSPPNKHVLRHRFVDTRVFDFQLLSVVCSDTLSLALHHHR